MNIKVMSLLTMLLGLLSCGTYSNIDVDRFDGMLGGGEVALVDVRTADEYVAGHIPGATNLDWYDPAFMEKMESAYPKGTPLAIYCRSGRRSASAAAKLSKAGYTVYNLLGGYLAWTGAGKETVPAEPM